MKSIKGELNREDWINWSKNVGIFATPLAIAFLTSLSQGVPMHDALLFLWAATVNALIDLLRKIQAGEPPISTHIEITPHTQPVAQQLG